MEYYRKGVFNKKGKIKKYVSFFLCMVFVFCFEVSVHGEEELKEPDLLAKSAVIIDGSNGRVLYGKNENQKMAMASTTKIMTCIVALEQGSPDKVITVSSKAAGMPKVHMNMIKGEQYYLKDLLYAMMLESYNDVSVAVAEGVCGSVSEFAKLMNQKAKEIGAVNTNFVTPNGLDADAHYSTAYDMALIGAYAIKNEKFVEIVNTRSYHLSDVEGKRNFTANNKDAFLTMDQDAIGIKTGFTGKAGYCFVGATKSNGRTFVSCVLACGWPPNKSYKWKDTVSLMKYGKDSYQIKKVLEKDKRLSIPIDNGTKGKISACILGESQMLLSKTDSVEFVSDIKYQLPLAKGDSVGTVDIFVNDKKIERHKIIAEESVEKYNYQYCIKKFFEFFIFQE